ncbi:MAG TPA: hypothetical protein PKU91_05835, partial [Phycisphaerales bacterium]|nr:hypothetical protein [Phycisphaerales bacterium]
MKHVSWMRTTIRSTAVLAWVLALAAGQANAQPEKKRPAGPPPDHVLKGPHVEDNSVPGQRGRFAGGRPD